MENTTANIPDLRSSAPGPSATRVTPSLDAAFQRAESTATLIDLTEAELLERRAQLEEARDDLESWAGRINSLIRQHDAGISRLDRALNSVRGIDEPQEAVVR